VEKAPLSGGSDMNPMQNHIRILGILHIVFGIIGVLVGLVVFGVMGGIAGITASNAEAEDAAIAVPIIGGIGLIIAICFIVVSAPAIIAGIGLMQMKSWARMLGIIISILELIMFPIGTALGAYGIWVLFSRDAQVLFDHGQVSPAVR
jgi:hypothetical protein